MSELRGGCSQFYFISIIYSSVLEAHVPHVGVSGRPAGARSLPFHDVMPSGLPFPAEQSRRLTATVSLHAGVRSQDSK